MADRSYLHPTGVRITLAADTDLEEPPRILGDLATHRVTITRRLPTSGPAGSNWGKVAVEICHVEPFAGVLEVCPLDRDGAALPESYAVSLHDVSEIEVTAATPTTLGRNSLAAQALAAMSALAEFAAGTVYEHGEPDYPSGADMVDKVNELVDQLGLTAVPRQVGS